MGSTSNTGFQFITSINTVTRDEETRRRVRSHARRQKLPNGPSQPPQSKRSGSQKDHTSKFRLKPTASSSGNHGKQEKKSRTNWLAVTVARELPNFSLLHIEKTPLTESLMKYCMAVCLAPQESVVEKWFNRTGAPTYLNIYYSGFLANAFAMNPEGTWVEALQLDKAATHAFIAMIAAMHNSLAVWADTSTIDFHRFQAVKSINERLNLEGKDDSKPISDGLVVAVALLVNIETFIGSLSAAAAHMSGLKRMVDLRGGIVEGFNHSSILQRSISWADYSYATAAQKPVVFPFIPQLASSLALHDRFTSRSMIANMEPLGFRDLTIHSREAIELFELLYSITDCINNFDYASLESTYGERIRVSDSIYMVEWRLCQLEETSRSRQSWKRTGSVPLLPSVEDERQPRHLPPTDLSDVLIYAAHLFLHLAIRGQPPSAQRHRALTDALMSALCDPVLALDLLSQPKPYGHPRTQLSRGGGDGQSTAENWSIYSSSSAVASAGIPKQQQQQRDELHANILLWALFVGACVRAQLPANESSALLGDPHEFFINSLRNYCRMRNIVEKDMLLEKLKQAVWLYSWCEHQLELVWQEVGEEIRS
ncbi:[NU+] prion formation protein 1 [Hypoxylon texense]